MTDEMTLSLTVNGQARSFSPAPANVAELVDALGFSGARVAVELNRRIVTRTSWAETPLKADDTLEIVHFVGGGA